jgi:hypothetical protein
VYPAVLLVYFTPAGVILVASLDLMVQFSMPYNEVGRTSVLYNFYLVLFRRFFGLYTLFLMPVNFR